jgi:adenylate cyclase
MVGLVALVQILTYLLVVRINRENALARIREDLDLGARFFQQDVDRRVAEFITGARLMSGDYAMRQLFLQPELDRATVRSALLSYSERLRAPVMILFTPEGRSIADTRVGTGPDDAAFRELIRRANLQEGDQQASGFAALQSDRLHVLAVVPLYAPAPEIVAWIGMAFPIDNAFAGDLKEFTSLDVTFTLARPDGSGAFPVASTLPPDLARTVAERSGAAEGQSLERLGKEQFVTTSRRLPLLSAGAARIALQRSLETELAPSRQLEWSLQIIIPACLAAAALLALGMARGVSRPVQMLAAFTEHVVRGDFSRRIELTRSDELGDLASAFNRMSAGLADRDRVRDLLGKVVSPEIAAQLLQSEAVLGGEEREVTILFSDLRNFTGLSERLPPREVLALLNRYLDRMSSIVEEHHGVVDKFIGDAIMALFGTPVADPEAADHALAAPQAMERALIALNTELAAEGRPRLAIGIGINTARVVAGNMGSQRRLNYTVIGDGVNVAARLEALTKDAAYGTRILISESTRKASRAVHPMRAVGGVVIHGRKETVMAFAVDSAM